ncbi:glucose-1-phosphate adenylyltransferase [Paenarthrobacter nicotinovorans]|nr:glucose-1-phosphate adenylyltransferase [Paenarthrobacter nicotinovorans]
MTQYKSHSLDRHISETWRMSTQLGRYVASVPAQQRVGKSWFLGSANAIYQSLNLIHDDAPDIVVVVGADHVYRMDFSQMVEQHIASGAKATVAAVRQPLNMANQFGVIEVDPNDPQKIAAFVEKPASTPGLAADPSQFLASMGNYVFNADALVEALHVDAERLDTKHDMGGDIIPYFVDQGEAGVYDFTLNDIPGATDRDRTYWRDVGTIDSFYDAHMDLISPVPVFNLYNSEWPIYTRQSISPPAKFVRGGNNTVGTALDSIVASGVVISGGIVEGSVLSNDAYVAAGSRVQDSVLMDKVYVGEGAVIKRAILDKNVKVPAGAAIGLDPALDKARGYKVTESGITVLAKGQLVPEPGEAELALSAQYRRGLPEAVKAATHHDPDIRDSAEKVAAGIQSRVAGPASQGAAN